MVSENHNAIQLSVDCINYLCTKIEAAKMILRKEARSSMPFLKTAKLIPEINSFVEDIQPYA